MKTIKLSFFVLGVLAIFFFFLPVYLFCVKWSILRGMHGFPPGLFFMPLAGIFNASSTKQTATNEQTEAENNGAGAQIIVGANNSGSVVVTSADPGVEESAINSINENTALAFSTIDHITAANTLASEAAANEASAQALNAANGYAVNTGGGVSANANQPAQPPVVSSSFSSTPSKGVSLTNISLVVTILAGLVSVYYYLKHKKAAS